MPMSVPMRRICSLHSFMNETKKLAAKLNYSFVAFYSHYCLPYFSVYSCI
jgi:hypothetical protein